MRYTSKKFSVAVGNQAYRDNFDRIFRSKEKWVCLCPYNSAQVCLTKDCTCECHKGQTK